MKYIVKAAQLFFMRRLVQQLRCKREWLLKLLSLTDISHRCVQRRLYILSNVCLTLVIQRPKELANQKCQNRNADHNTDDYVLDFDGIMV